MMQIYWLALGVLSTWRITHLLQAEDGPGAILAKARRALGSGFWGQLADCFYCLSLWLALPLAWTIGHDIRERLFLWPALSAGAILLERLGKAEPPPAAYFEDKETTDGMLRKSEDASDAADRGPGTNR
jgi:hypothetical protein